MSHEKVFYVKVAVFLLYDSLEKIKLFCQWFSLPADSLRLARVMNFWGTIVAKILQRYEKLK